MSSPWRVLDFCDYKGRLTAGEGALHVKDVDVPLIDIAVMLIGTSVDLHSSVFDRAAHFDIPIIHCDWKAVPVSATFSWSDNSRVAARHIAQSELDLPRRKNAWMRIVKAKISGQAVNLKGDPKGMSHLMELVSKVRSGDPSNCEGQAARYYWRRAFEDPDFRRITRTRDSLNGMLDYGYSIIRGATIRSILSAGLWPALGIWHRNRSNNFALADDLVEPFRPTIDAVVIELSNAGASLDKFGKRALAGVLDRGFTSQGYTVGTEINRFSQNIARYIEGEEKLLDVPCFGGFVETR